MCDATLVEQLHGAAYLRKPLHELFFGDWVCIFAELYIKCGSFTVLNHGAEMALKSNVEVADQLQVRVIKTPNKLHFTFLHLDFGLRELTNIILLHHILLPISVLH